MIKLLLLDVGGLGVVVGGDDDDSCDDGVVVVGSDDDVVAWCCYSTSPWLHIMVFVRRCDMLQQGRVMVN